MNDLSAMGDVTEPTWIKSSRSFALGNCVEVASLGGGMIGLRDSKNKQGSVLRFTIPEWQAFLAGILDGEFGSLGGDMAS